MSFKLTAGAALTALAGAVAMTGAATAADLGGMRGSIKDYQPLPQVYRGGGNCYFRADIGYAKQNSPDVKWPVNNDVTTNNYYGDGSDENPYIVETLYESIFVTDEVSNAEMENRWFGEAGVGCGTGGSRGIRGELVLGVRSNSKIDGEPGFYSNTVTNNDYTSSPPPDGVPDSPPSEEYDDPLHTSVKSYTMMLNAYKDLGAYGRFTPYVGAGVGVAYNIVDDVYFTENPNLVNRIEGDRELAFAWALMAGVGIMVTDRTTLDIGYRYSDLGKATSGRVDSGGFVNPAVQIDDLTSHEIKVGLRYNFGGSDCCASADYAPIK